MEKPGRSTEAINTVQINALLQIMDVDSNPFPGWVHKITSDMWSRWFGWNAGLDHISCVCFYDFVLVYVFFAIWLLENSACLGFLPLESVLLWYSISIIFYVFAFEACIRSLRPTAPQGPPFLLDASADWGWPVLPVRPHPDGAALWDGSSECQFNRWRHFRFVEWCRMLVGGKPAERLDAGTGLFSVVRMYGSPLHSTPLRNSSILK